MGDMAGGRTIVLLMSGGVDSSVAALLLLQEGWRVLGLTLRIPGVWGGPGEAGNGPPVEAGASAARMAGVLGIPHRILDAGETFRARVIAPFLRDYREGRTPNPCVDCNRSIKFGLLMDAAAEWAGDARVPVATGHYARILLTPSGARLARALDEGRDQSYFLCDVDRARLHRVRFPLGELTKPKVREIARDAGLTVADRPDSMEVCFLAGTDYRERVGDDGPGPIRDLSGALLGRHKGLSRYTLGQRQGLGIAAPHPLYVLRLDVPHNALVVGPKEAAFRTVVTAKRPNVLAPELLGRDTVLMGKTRSRSPLSPCRIASLDEGTLTAEFQSPQFAPAPGQRLALYGGEVLAASGVIV
ncbi:tRNA 2-thiouridine(34) synthase MnmA [uncultured Fretibacterium sp.]|uniref:tRNA 2-thiouridine(34) synthase MnmA n=1 Tax=uncultured Fretibacterium sp. TaxID=1678694 RepID=UPI002623ABBC|nr:tRNA 2-thiouridine(34) synthase MnmA [uncultured Fretibacterium sp.]